MTANSQAMQDDKLLYQHNNVTISENNGIRLGCYYFPSGTSKMIPWDSIASVELRDLKWYHRKTWGNSLMTLDLWFHYDRMSRECKQLKAIIVHMKAGGTSPALTVRPEQADELFHLIQRHVAKIKQ
eukprot:CAMPEP_0202854678 /NCGR_PEP_ID=MMETSP1389-20130828/91125_1 /ASSEMBLY_ACC=CAM_ASM_000865 /TAXON_ID=302021 /ORGANISM="Rhodomonas sp., Strain CCMP768" /LENGTH=126 /DNA_ID=CAMNT_0049533275 /DNA_START=391 /DNA_END=771 /DNA_ORIENTATION=-